MSKKKKKQVKIEANPAAFTAKGSLSLVIPCYNEAARLSNLLKDLRNFAQQWKNPLEIIVVDDGSTDDTATIIQKDFEKQIGEKADFRFLQLSQNSGKGAALKEGVAAAQNDFILTLDADMATRPHELFRWLKILGSDFKDNQILIASREDKRSEVAVNNIRRLAGWIFNFFIQLFTNLNLQDTQCGFKLYPKEVAKNLFSQLQSTGWAHDVELLYRAKLNKVAIQSMPVKWVEQEGSKINLLTDSFKMFFQTIFISLRVNFDYFVLEPLRSLKGKVNNRAAEPAIFRLLFLMLSLFLLFFMPMISSDYGITGDEYVQKEYGEKVLAYFESNGEDESALNYKNLYFYGGMFDYYAAKLHRWFPNTDVYEFRHLLNSLVGWLLILFTGLVAKEITGSWRAAFLALLFITLTPRIFGHAMNNPKDIPFAASYIFTLLYMMRFIKQLPRPSKKTIIFLILGIAASINVRVGGLLLIAYFGLFVILSYLLIPRLRNQLKNKAIVVRTFVTSSIIALGGYFLGLLYWPYALQKPLSHPFKALSEMADFSTSIRMLFKGQHLWSDELPWNYIPHWVMMTAPLFLLLGLLSFIGFYVYKFKFQKRILISYLAFTAIFPVTYAVFKGSQLYDGMRHFLFIMPVLAVLASYGWNGIFKLANRNIQIASSLALVGLLSLPGIWMMKNHPYQYLYFNELSGGLKKAYAKYETDYWMVSVKKMADWLLENVDDIKTGKEVVVRTNAYEPLKHYLGQKAPHVKVGYLQYSDRYKYATDYFVFISRFVDKEMMEKGLFPPPNVVYEEKTDGVVLGVITTKPKAYDSEAFQANKRKDYSEAARLYDKQLEIDPNNESVLENAIKNAIALQDYELVKKYADQMIAISSTYASGAYFQGIYFYNIGDTEKAREWLEKTIDLNYKYSPAYYYLSVLYARANNPSRALELIEKFDDISGTTPQAFELGAQIANQLGDKAKALYFQAKAAYFKKDYQNSFQLVTQSLTINPDYKPAVKLNEVYQKSLQNQ